MSELAEKGIVLAQYVEEGAFWTGEIEREAYMSSEGESKEELGA